MGVSKGIVNGLGALSRPSDRIKATRKRRPITPTQAKVLELYEAGATFQQIAAELGWQQNAKGRYKTAGIRVMLDMAFLKMGEE